MGFLLPTSTGARRIPGLLFELPINSKVCISHEPLFPATDPDRVPVRFPEKNPTQLAGQEKTKNENFKLVEPTPLKSMLVKLDRFPI